MNQFSLSCLTWGRDIVEKYPDLYLTLNPRVVGYYRGPDGDFCNLRYGFEHGEGWRGLVEEFSAAATTFLRLVRHEQPDAWIRACIVKEKFGGWRWQGDDNLKDEFIDLYYSIIHRYENMSHSICETTGKYGEWRGDLRWQRTLCEEEYQKALAKQRDNA